jgi:hypothetical protein
MSPKTTPMAAIASGNTPAFSASLPLEFIFILDPSWAARNHNYGACLDASAASAFRLPHSTNDASV